LYNEKRKQQYIDEKSQSAKLSQNLYDAFSGAEQYEEKMNRDICEWTTKEIIAFYKKFATPYVQTLIVIHNSLTQYCNWCLENGLVSDNINHFSEIPTETICKCVDVNALKDRVFTREELLEEIKELPNYSDKFIILGLFEGIPVKGGVMNRITMGDLDGCNLILRNEKGIRIATRTITKELRHIMENADAESTYQSMSSQHRTYPYDMRETTVLKTILSKKNALRNSDAQLATRMRKCFNYLGYEGITIKSIMESGRIQFIKNFCRENKLPWQEALTDSDYRSIHEDIYGKIQSVPVYLKTYGSLFE